MDSKVFEKINMPDVKNVILVASGKGGVGKSTVAVNLSVSLARQGYKVALVDADLYGPSIPIMFGIQNIKPQGIIKNGKEFLVPIEKYGIKIISIGFFIPPEESLIWRGPMAANGLTQIFRDSDWGEIDYMIVDFPPGTGDIQLTTIQKLKVAGVIIVTTPQQVAIADARKAANMFSKPEFNVPIIGVVENMSWFTPIKHPDEKYYVFGKNGGKNIAKELNTKLLGQIPLTLEIGEVSDSGKTIYNQADKNIMAIFDEISTQITKIIRP